MQNDLTFFGTCMSALNQRAYYTAFYDTFKLVRADTPNLKKQAYQLRYDVYIEENGRIDLGKKSCALEKDIFDKYSEHVLMYHKASGMLAGTVRVILPRRTDLGHSFPIQSLCDHPYLHMDDKSSNLCQISRMCLSKEFRNRPLDGPYLPAYYDQDYTTGPTKQLFVKRTIPYAAVGLLSAALEIALEHKILNCVWMLDEDQMRIMRKLGMIYKTLGPRINLDVKQQPFIFNIKHTLENMNYENPQCGEVVSRHGELNRLACELEHHHWQDKVFDEKCKEQIFDLVHQKIKR